jgi:hypothetical protein
MPMLLGLDPLVIQFIEQHIVPRLHPTSSRCSFAEYICSAIFCYRRNQPNATWYRYSGPLCPSSGSR